MSANEDRRISRTRHAIREALMELLDLKSIKSITVKELAQRANINRKTFYAHYACIEDVIAELEDEIIENMEYYLREMLITEQNLLPQYLIQFINLVYHSNPVFFEHLVMARNYAFLADKLKQMCKKQLLAGNTGAGASGGSLDGSACSVSYLVEFFMGGATALYVEWLRTGRQLPFEQVTDLLFRTLADGLRGIMPAEEPL